jgi:hypothetical protein
MPPEPFERYEHRWERRRKAAAALFIHTNVDLTIALASLSLASAEPVPYHNSILTGEMWVQELLHGHPERIKTELGMSVPTFVAFCAALRMAGLSGSRWVTVHEQAAIFLYTSRTGLRLRHVGERFQRTIETISQYVAYLTYIHAFPHLCPNQLLPQDSIYCHVRSFL